MMLFTDFVVSVASGKTNSRFRAEEAYGSPESPLSKMDLMTVGKLLKKNGIVTLVIEEHAIWSQSFSSTHFRLLAPNAIDKRER